MFIWSVRASTIKFFCAAFLAVGTIITLMLMIPSYDSAAASGDAISISYENVKTNDDRIAFLSQFGWTVEATPVTEETFAIPEELDRVLAGYNEVQKKQGLDLSRYKKKEVKHYTYTVTNFDGADGAVYANIFVYRGRVIAGDISSASEDSSFVLTLEGK